MSADSQASKTFCSCCHPNTHQRAIIASHSYLLINPLKSSIISDILDRYSLKNLTNVSGVNFSEIEVNHSISEKNIVIFLLSPSRFIFPDPDKISAAISFETYSHRALFNLFLCLFSIKYFTIFAQAKEIMSHTINS
ncbi:MAG: hypothetical protein ACPHY8_00645 [Patescibacteria group bacterium]